MEKWQKDYITQNLPLLSYQVKRSPTLLQIFLSVSVLSKADYQQLITCEKNYGQIQQSQMLLGILATRTGGYESLTKALYQCNQSGATMTLLQGFEENGVPNPFEKCNIPIQMKDVMSQKIRFQGVVGELQDICTKMDPNDLDHIFKRRLNARTYSDFFAADPIRLVKDTIPSPIPYYIERSLSIQKWLNPTAFTSLKNDIFLFENIEFSHLTKLGRHSAAVIDMNEEPGATFFAADISRNQRHKLTSRFILLEHESHYQNILQKTTVPVHWIRVKNDKYELFASTGNFAQIKKHLEGDESKQTQEEFLESAQYAKAICISDSPGMGKSVLLADIARNLKQRLPRNIVLFVRLSEFLQRFNNEETIPDATQVMNTLIAIVTDNNLSFDILSSLIFKYDHPIELCFDGYDELSSEQLETADAILSSINSNFKKARIFVTSRLHMCSQLETILSAYAYNILPFQKSDQINFLVNYWKTSCSGTDTSKFQNLATTCLSKLETEITDVQRNIAGIPLQCRLLADVYVEDARMYAKSDCSLADYGIFVRIDSIYDMYKIHIDKCFKIEADQTAREKIIDFHMYLAMKLLFPELLSDENIPIPPDVNLCKFGLLEIDGLNDELRFVHRTFAEFLVAQFVATCVKSNRISELGPWMKDKVNTVKLLFETTLCTTEHREDDPFEYINTFKSLHSVITFFADKHIRQVNVVEDQGSIDSFNSALQNSKYFNLETMFQTIGCTVVHDSYGLFSILKPSLMILNTSDIFYASPEFQWNGLLLLSAKFSNIDFFRDICNLVSSIPETSNETTNVTLLKDTSIPATSLHVAVYRGHYFISDYLLGSMTDYVLCGKHLLHTCVSGSHTNSAAIVQEKAQIIKSLISRDENLLDERNDRGSTPILEDGIHIALLECLITSGADPTELKSSTNSNSAHAAALHLQPGDFHTFCCLIVDKKLAYIFKTQDKDGKTPIHISLSKIEILVETLKLLNSSAGVRFNIKNKNNETEFGTAVSHNRSKTLIQEIINVYPDWKFDNSNDITPLHNALDSENFEVSNLFIDLGFDVNAVSGRVNHTPLHIAMKSQCPIEVTQKLIEKGSKVNAATETGLTPLHYAVESVENIRLLIENGAVINSATYNRGMTPLHYAIWKIKSTDAAIPSTKVLVEKGANVNARSKRGLTPLHLATFLNEDDAPEITKLLLEKGANINAGDGKYRTPLRYAIENRDYDLKTMFKNRGAKLNSRINMPWTWVWKGLKKLVHIPLDSDDDYSTSESDNESEFSVDDWITDELDIDIDRQKFTDWTKLKKWVATWIDDGWDTSDSDE